MTCLGYIGENIAGTSSPQYMPMEARRYLELFFSFLLENPDIPSRAAHLRAIRDLMFVLEQAYVAGHSCQNQPSLY